MTAYGDVDVTFTSYYKHTFIFTGTTAGGDTVTVCVGGNADHIYRLKVSPGQSYKIKDLCPSSGSSFDSTGNLLEQFYDY